MAHEPVGVMTGGVTPSEEMVHISPMEVTPKLGKGAQDTWRLSWLYGGRLDKTGVTPRQVMRRGWRQTRMAGAYTDQRLNLSKLGKATAESQGFKPDPGNLHIRICEG